MSVDISFDGMVKFYGLVEGWPIEVSIFGLLSALLLVSLESGELFDRFEGDYLVVRPGDLW